MRSSHYKQVLIIGNFLIFKMPEGLAQAEHAQARKIDFEPYKALKLSFLTQLLECSP